MNKKNLPLLDVHTHQPYFEKNLFGLTCSPCKEGVLWCYGIHPWFIEKDGTSQFRKLEFQCAQEKPLMIGEIGLDRLRGADFGIQIEIFKRQVDLASDLKLACVIHSVKSFSEIISLRKRYTVQARPWILHDFAANQIIADNAIQSGCYLSFSPRAMRRINAGDRKLSYLKSLDLNYLFLETDERKNVDIKDMFQWFCQLRRISTDQLNRILWNNLEKVTGKNHEYILAKQNRIVIRK